MENLVPEQRQYSLEEILSITFNIIKKHWLKFLLIGVIVYLPLLILANFLDKSYLLNIIPKVILDQPLSGSSAFAGMGGFGAFGTFREMITSLIPMYYFAIGLLFFGFLVNFCFAEIVQKCAHGEEPTLKEALMASIKKYPVGLLTYIIAGISLFFLTFALIVPGIIFGVFWTFFMIVIILRNRWGIDALRYSFHVVRGRWWRVLGFTLVFALMAGLISMVPSQVGQLFLKNPYLFSLFSLLSYIIQSFTMIASTVFFLNLESTSKFLVRKQIEGEISNFPEI